MRTFLLLSLTLLSAAPSRAAFEDIGAGARAPGMGNAFTAIADDVYAIHYNPAGLALLTRPELGSSYSRLFIGLADDSKLNHSFLGYAHPLKEGTAGVIGGAWQQFSLGSLYKEDTLTASYGRLLSPKVGIGSLYGGLNLKYLRRSFGSFPEETDSLTGNGLQVTPGAADPVLAGRKSVGVPDADLGLLYRLPEHYAIGLSLAHLLRPNVAFNSRDSNRLPLAVRLGLSYRGLFSVLSAQLETKQSSAGTQDKVVTLAAERWLPRLFIGDFAFRGALASGSRDFKQISIGFGYRTRRFEADYAFLMPINSVASTAGSHRLGLSVRFGRLSDPDESIEMILEAMRQLRAGVIPAMQAPGRGLSASQKVLVEEYLAHSRSLTSRASYQAALEPLGKAMAVSPNDPQLLKAYSRLNFTAESFKELPDYKSNAAHAALHQGILSYLGGNDLEALEKTAYALSLASEDKSIEAFLVRLEAATGMKRPSPKPGPKLDQRLQDTLTRAASALEESRYEDAIRESREALKQEPSLVPAWENLGTAYFALGDYAQALDAWRKAYALEKNPARRAAHRNYIRSIENLLKRPKPPAQRTYTPPAPAADPQALQKIYDEGVDAYTSGQLNKAKDSFERILALDPDNVPAAKALRRVKEEMAPK